MNNEIRTSRMANITLNVVRQDKTPLSKREVIIEQVKHKFLFGTAAFDLVPLTNGEYEGKKKEQAEARAEKLTALFNAATLPFYWARFEPQRGQPMTAQVKNAAQWCRDHGLIVKGHPLCWHTLTADWLLSMSNAEILEAQTARIQ